MLATFTLSPVTSAKLMTSTGATLPFRMPQLPPQDWTVD